MEFRQGDNIFPRSVILNWPFLLMNLSTFEPAETPQSFWHVDGFSSLFIPLTSFM